MTWYQHVRALNDANGNPRRLFLVYEPDAFRASPDSLPQYVAVSAINEGYEGRPEWLRDAVELPAIDVPPSEYKRLLKRYGA